MEAQASPAASSGSKPLLVRVKRKRLQPPVESLWLEVSDRPTKRLESQLSSFSLNGADIGTTGQEKPTRLLFHHLDTFTSFGANEATRVDCLFKEIQNESSKEKHRDGLKSKDLLRNKFTTSRQHYEAFMQKARFEQVWKSRKEERKPDAMSENFELYDLMRVDVDMDALERNRKIVEERRKEAQMLQSFLPLFKDHMPSVAEEVESSSLSSSQKEEDEYVYDVYALEESPDDDSAQSHDYPLVHVVDNDYFRWGTSDESDYDSEDSNDENNPMNDYPEEEDDTEEDEESDSGSVEERDCSEDSEEYHYDVLEDVDNFEKYDNDWSDISYGSSEERDNM